MPDNRRPNRLDTESRGSLYLCTASSGGVASPTASALNPSPEVSLAATASPLVTESAAQQRTFQRDSVRDDPIVGGNQPVASTGTSPVAVAYASANSLRSPRTFQNHGTAYYYFGTAKRGRPETAMEDSLYEARAFRVFLVMIMLGLYAGVTYLATLGYAF